MGIAADSAVRHHQFVRGRGVIPEHRLQPQLAIVADIVAVHRQRVGGAVAAGGHVDDPGVVQGGQLAGGIGADAALGHGEHAAVVDGKCPAVAGAVTEVKIPGQVEVRIVVEIDCFPADVTGGVAGGGVIEGQLVIALPAIDGRGAAEQAFVQAAEQCGVVAVAHQHGGFDLTAIDPVQGVVADAGANLAVDHAAAHGNAVVAAAGADIAADGAAGNNDGVAIKAGHQIAEDRSAGHVIDVLVQFHVDPANGAAGLLRHITVLERPDDGARGHQERVPAVALGQGLNLPAGHHEVVDAVALGHGARDRTGTDAEAVGAVALSHGTDNAPGVHVDRVGAWSGHDVAVDDAGTAGGQRQGDIADRIRETGGAAATVADIVVNAGPGSEYASRLSLLQGKTQQGKNPYAKNTRFGQDSFRAHKASHFFLLKDV